MSGPGSWCIGAAAMLLLLEPATRIQRYAPIYLFGVPAPHGAVAQRSAGLAGEAPPAQTPVPQGPAPAAAPAVMSAPQHLSRTAAPAPLRKVPPVVPPRPPGVYLDGLLWRAGVPAAAWINGRLQEPPRERAREGLRENIEAESGPPAVFPGLRLPGWKQALRVGQGWPGGHASGAPARDPWPPGALRHRP